MFRWDGLVLIVYHFLAFKNLRQKELRILIDNKSNNSGGYNPQCVWHDSVAVSVFSIASSLEFAQDLPFVKCKEALVLPSLL
jgi:hypothetical protein